MRGTSRRLNARRLGAVAAVASAAVLLPALASAHVERASYWPNPAADTADGVPTGGAVPTARPLFSALDASQGETRVVCQRATAATSPGSSRQDQTVSRAEVDRLTALVQRIRNKLKKAKGKKKRKKLKKQRGNAAAQLNQAQRAYDQALAAEMLARQGSSQGSSTTTGIDSMQRLDAALADAVANGYVVRPSEPRVNVTQAEADQLRAFNEQLFAHCSFDSIQEAVNASGNNDRVVVMPGIYTEPKSRAAPTNDPSCDQYEEVNDRPGDGMGGFQTGANTYTYVFFCPNDQQLIAVLGREPRDDLIPPTPNESRYGIPDEGPCIRCNLQLEGSGISPDDVVIDAGNVASGNGSPVDPVKDVGVRADRADGFVFRNILLRHVREHGIYPHEVDGYLLEHFKTFYAEEYGTLQFASDHGLVTDCETAGSGDAGIYPGSAPDTGNQGMTETGQPFRYNTEIRRCDSHHNSIGYSGTAANAVWVHNVDFYDNALGFSTDVFTAAGHPGFPQDSDKLENNEFYDNNFNPYLPHCDTAQFDPNTCSDIDPTVPVPVGTGMWIAGGNDDEVLNNHFWDNWRRGAMLFSVPDAFVCGDSATAGGNQQHGCDETEVNTSYRNKFHDNVMSRSPNHAPDATWPSGQDAPDLNGVDFWWDQFPVNTGNCWYDNTGSAGTAASVTSSPPGDVTPQSPPWVPPFLPDDCATSVGAVGGPQETELLACLASFDQGVSSPACTWFETPTEP